MWMMSVPMATCAVGGDVLSRRGREDAALPEGQARPQDRLADGAPETDLRRGPIAGGAVQELARLPRHAEGAVVEAGADVLRGSAAPGQLEVVDQPGAVQGDRREAPPLDQIDDEGAEPDLDRVRAHAEHDGASRPDRPRDATDGGAEIARREDVG
jgi:hypothetical protein